MATLRNVICGWTFILAALVFTFGAVIAFVVIGEALAPTVVKFAGSALLCVAAQFIYDEAESIL